MRANDDSGLIFKAKSSSGAWSQVVNLSNTIRGKKATNAVCGPDLYGFSSPEVAKLIQELPGADKCQKNKWQTFVVTGRG